MPDKPKARSGRASNSTPKGIASSPPLDRLRRAEAVKVGGATGKVLLLVLHRAADNSTGKVVRSQVWLAARAECDERTVRRWLRRLEDAGLIVRTPRWNGHRRLPDRITVLPFPADMVSATEAGRVSGSQGDSGSGSQADTDDPPSGQRVRGSASTSLPSSPENVSAKNGSAPAEGSGERKNDASRPQEKHRSTGAPATNSDRAKPHSQSTEPDTTSAKAENPLQRKNRERHAAAAVARFMKHGGERV